MVREREETKIAAMLRHGSNDNGTATLSTGLLSPGRRNELEEMKNLLRTNKGVFHNPEVRKQARRVYRMLEKVARKHSSTENDQRNKASSYGDLMEKVNLVVYSQSEVQSLETDVSSIDASDIEEESPVKDDAPTAHSKRCFKREMKCGADLADEHASPRDPLVIDEADPTKGRDRPEPASRFGFLGMICLPVSWCGPGDTSGDDPVTSSDGNASICNSIRTATVAENEAKHLSVATDSTDSLAVSAREHYLIQLDATSPAVCLERVERSSEAVVTDKRWPSIDPAEKKDAQLVQIELKPGIWLSYNKKQWKSTPGTSSLSCNVRLHSL